MYNSIMYYNKNEYLALFHFVSLYCSVVCVFTGLFCVEQTKLCLYVHILFGMKGMQERNRIYVFC